MSGVVIKLPTAAARKVRYVTNRAQREAKALLPQHPAKWVSPWHRKADRAAEALQGIEPSAALLIASAIFRTLDAKEKTCVQIYAASLCDSSVGRQASEWLRLVGGVSIAESHDIKAALRRLDGEA